MSTHSEAASVSINQIDLHHHQHNLHISEQTKGNVWLSSINAQAATTTIHTDDRSTLSGVTGPSKNCIPQFPSPTVPAVHHADATKKSNFSSSCRYPQDNLDLFYKYANIATELPLVRPSPTQFPQISDLSSTQQTNGNLYGSPFSPVGYHMNIPQGILYESASAAVPNARACALPSPTIYPPTPPPSAPWIHPWFVGDTF